MLLLEIKIHKKQPFGIGSTDYNMEKIKLIQTIGVQDDTLTYSEILSDVNAMRNKIQLALKSENLENEFEIIINVENRRESFYYKQDKTKI